MFGDSSAPDASRLTRVSRTQQSLLRGSVDGRLREAAPIPPDARQSEESSSGTSLFVGPEDPGVDNYDFWFDTDEPG